MKTAFIGHRQIFSKTLPQRLIEAIKAEIEGGCFSFTMGTHGEFDRLALQSCCFVNEKAYRSGAKTAMIYAKRKGLRIINLYDEKDEPFYGMTHEEISAKWKEICNISSKEK